MSTIDSYRSRGMMLIVSPEAAKIELCDAASAKISPVRFSLITGGLVQSTCQHQLKCKQMQSIGVVSGYATFV
jgi:hypothetical protein